MSSMTSEALIIPGGGLTPQEQLTDGAARRMDTAVAAWRQGVAPHLVTSGGHSFKLKRVHSVTEAEAMKRYAITMGVPAEAVTKEEPSLETIGNALFTKTDVVVPNDWEHLTVVTSVSHLPRVLKVFRHVYGNDFEIRGMPAPERVTMIRKGHEALSMIMLREVLRGTKLGDDAAIKERLFDLVPGYGDSTIPRLTMKSLLGLAKKV